MQEGFGVVVHERLTEPRATIEQLLAKPTSFSNLPAFLDHNGRCVELSSFRIYLIQTYGNTFRHSRLLKKLSDYT